MTPAVLLLVGGFISAAQILAAAAGLGRAVIASSAALAALTVGAAVLPW
jgi:hypothetical protein